jgi:hypothetical protein
MEGQWFISTSRNSKWCSQVATIVKHTKTGEQLVLLGAGFGAYQSKKPHAFFGDCVADTESGAHEMVCVCNSPGLIGWIYSDQVNVVSVDGSPVR